MNRTRTVAALTLAAALLTIPAQTANASDSDVQDRIDEVLAEFPGGVQTAANEVTWGDGDVILTVVDPTAPTTMAVGSCATGAHCVYSGSNLTGSKLTFTTCTTQSVAPLGAPVKSIANAHTSGVVRVQRPRRARVRRGEQLDQHIMGDDEDRMLTRTNPVV